MGLAATSRYISPQLRSGWRVSPKVLLSSDSPLIAPVRFPCSISFNVTTLLSSAVAPGLFKSASQCCHPLLIANFSDPRPNDGKFLTVSITNPSGFAISPGDTDPAIAARLALYAANLTERVPSHEMPARKSYFQELANDLREKAMRMTRGRSDGEKWWTGLDEDYDDDDSAWGSMPYDTDDDDNSPAGNDAESTASSPAKKKGDDSDGDGERGKGKSEEGQKKEAAGGASTAPLDMVYDCDGTLGSPTALDCEKLSWSGLQPASTTETLIPGQPKIYTQGTCALGISTAIPTTITWAHILAAFETLNTLCVQNPLKAVKGGRAFFGQQHQQQGVTAGGSGWMGGRRRTKDKRDGWWTWMWASSSSSKSKGKRDQVGDVSGAEALPAGINATVWRHGGAGTAEEEGEEAGRLQCEWAKAVAGLDVSGCS